MANPQLARTAPPAALREPTVRTRLDHESLSRAQIAAICVAGLLSALDGFDVLSVTFIAPALVREWAITKAVLGLVLSSGLVGMAAGSLLIAPLADVVGRRVLLLLGLVSMSVGSLLCAVAHGVADLCAYRLFTGVGIGVVVAVLPPIATEFSNVRRRSLSVSSVSIGYTLGGVVGGLLAAYILHAHGWRSVFVSGAVFVALCLPLVLVYLPESPGFLLARGGPRDLERLSRMLRRFGREDAIGLPPGEPPFKTSYAALFHPDLRRSTASLAAANLLAVIAVYYFLSWLPQMVVDAGFKPSVASLAAAVANLAGGAACLTLGLVGRPSSMARIAAIVLIAAGLSTAAFGLAPAKLAFIMVAGAVCGALLLASVYTLYATLTVSFPALTRTSASGFIIGLGRFGSILGAYATGWLFTGGLNRLEVSCIYGGLVVAGGLILLAAPPRPIDGGAVDAAI